MNRPLNELTVVQVTVLYEGHTLVEGERPHSKKFPGWTLGRALGLGLLVSLDYP